MSLHIHLALLWMIVLPVISAVYHSCQDVYYDKPYSKSGQYKIYNKNQQVYTVWCEFHQNYGYAFVSNTSRVVINVEDLFTDRSRAILRHLTTSGVQKETEVSQISKYHSQPLAFFYNKNIGYAQPMNHAQLGPYLYLGFLPKSIASRRGTQGYRAGGHDYVFNNCDGNPNSYIALYFNNKHTQSLGYFRRVGGGAIITNWIRHSAVLTKDRYLDPHFYFPFEMHLGGCGGYGLSHHRDLAGITGAAIGYKFDIKNPCDSRPCNNGGTCSPDGRKFMCECPEDYTGAVCQTVVS